MLPRQKMRKGTKIEYFRKGDLIFRQGEASRALYLIEDGVVELHCDGCIRLPLRTGDFFGEIAALSSLKRSASAVCLEDCELVRIAPSELKEMLSSDPEFKAHIFRKFFARLFHSKYRGTQVFLGTKLEKIEKFFENFEFLEFSSDAEMRPTGLYFILWGQVTAHYPSGFQVTKGAGEFVGQVGLVKNAKLASRLCPTRESGVLWCDYSKLNSLLQGFPVMQAFLVNLASRGLLEVPRSQSS